MQLQINSCWPCLLHMSSHEIQMLQVLTFLSFTESSLLLVISYYVKMSDYYSFIKFEKNEAAQRLKQSSERNKAQYFQAAFLDLFCSHPAHHVIIPVISGCFSRRRSPYLNTVLVVSVPAINKSNVVLAKFSTVYTSS